MVPLSGGYPLLARLRCLGTKSEIPQLKGRVGLTVRAAIPRWRAHLNYRALPDIGLAVSIRSYCEGIVRGITQRASRESRENENYET